MTNPLRTASVAATTVAMPTLLFAEVSDKVITPAGMWQAALTGALIALAAAWVRPILLWGALPLGLFLAGQGMATVLDKFVGPAVIREQGQVYAVHAFSSAAMVVAGGALGVMLHRRRQGAVRNGLAR